MRAKRLMSTIVPLALCFPINASAQLIYEFADEDGGVRAILELSELPASHREVVSLTFVSDFGLLETGAYGGTFDGSISEVFAYPFGSGHLGIDAAIADVVEPQFYDLDAPVPNQPSPVSEATLTLGFSVSGEGLDDDDYISYSATFATGVVEMERIVGHWQLVPEPTGLEVYAFLFLGIRRRRRGPSSDDTPLPRYTPPAEVTWGKRPGRSA